MSIITFRREKTIDCLEEARPLLLMHHAEVSRFPDRELDPNFAQLIAMEDAGHAKLFTARDGGQLVGYASFFVGPSPHHQAMRQAVQNALFIHPEKRGFGARFIDWCDEQLKNDGADAVFHFVPATRDFSPALVKLGYSKAETVYLRRL